MARFSSVPRAALFVLLSAGYGSGCGTMDLGPPELGAVRAGRCEPLAIRPQPLPARSSSRLPGVPSFRAQILPDGDLATAERVYHTRLHVEERDTGHVMLEVHGSEQHEPVKILRFTADGHHLVTAGKRLLTSVWNLQTGRFERAIQPTTDPARWPWILALSPNGGLVANRAGEYLELWSTHNGLLQARLGGHVKDSYYSEELDSAAFSNDGAYVATGDELGTLRVFEATTGKLMTSFDAPEGRLQALAWSPDDAYLASSCRGDATVRIRESRSGRLVSILSTDIDNLSHLSFSGDGKTLVAADLFDELRSFDLRTCATHRIEDWPPCHVFEDGSCGGVALYDVAISPDGSTILGIFDDDGAVLWDAKSGRRLLWLKLPATDRAWSGAFSPDGRVFAVGTLSGVDLFRLDEDRRVAPLVRLVNLTADGESAYVLDTASEVYQTPTAPWPEPQGPYDAFGVGESGLLCREGELIQPFGLCEERLRVKGLLAARLNGRSSSERPLQP